MKPYRHKPDEWDPSGMTLVPGGARSCANRPPAERCQGRCPFDKSDGMYFDVRKGDQCWLAPGHEGDCIADGISWDPADKYEEDDNPETPWD